ncbi:hypothetical protein [Devosia sp. RR2S18]|jgi:hypothetical protein|uniref:hypothetical protein n=1 Tax=Devosia rhizosphaerae TaxID=3049774 RepID=UPI002540AECE|nr:hypothetical protein [Devosia sp. RR2S18]WIJ23790.1 hypothetical protein QOV41_12060 [Devosia sp. RR2S18]HEV7293222.1 hypothetical protein [Devosia sp.]
MHVEHYQDVRRARAPEDKEQKVDPMWSADEDERRLAIFKRAAAGARKTLRGQN